MQNYKTVKRSVKDYLAIILFFIFSGCKEEIQTKNSQHQNEPEIQLLEITINDTIKPLISNDSILSTLKKNVVNWRGETFYYIKKTDANIDSTQLTYYIVKEDSKYNLMYEFIYIGNKKLSINFAEVIADGKNYKFPTLEFGLNSHLKKYSERAYERAWDNSVIMANLKTISTSKDVIIKFYGQLGHSIHRINQNELDDLQKIMNIYDSLQKE